MKIINCLSIAVLLFLAACTNSYSSGSSNPKDTVPAPVTREQTLKMKPAFPGFFPKSYIIGEDTTYLRIVSNSPFMEKAWMVYYDTKDSKWATMSWQGFGDNNQILGDTIFSRKNGLINGASSEDAPEFYFAYSEDSGRTWKPHHISEESMYCNKGTALHRYNVVLTSEPFLNNTHRAYLGAIIQHSHYMDGATSNSVSASLNFDYYCNVARTFPQASEK